MFWLIVSAVFGGQRNDAPLRAALEAMGRGDQAALGQFYDLTNRMIYGVILKILGNSEDAEEVLSDVYMQAWRQAGSFSPDRGSPMTWLILLARSRSLDRLRSQKTRKTRETVLEADHFSISDKSGQQSAEAERRTLVRALLNELGPDHRMLVELAFFEGLTHTDLSARLGLPLGTVKTRIRIAMNKIRERMGEQMEVA
jgi:RNA polymerase sigma-70 factor (ECF subfamily)